MGKESITGPDKSQNKDGGESWTVTHNVSNVRITNPRSRALNLAIAWLISFLSLGPLLIHTLEQRDRYRDSGIPEFS